MARQKERSDAYFPFRGWLSETVVRSPGKTERPTLSRHGVVRFVSLEDVLKRSDAFWDRCIWKQRSRKDSSILSYFYWARQRRGYGRTAWLLIFIYSLITCCCKARKIWMSWLIFKPRPGKKQQQKNDVFKTLHTRDQTNGTRLPMRWNWRKNQQHPRAVRAPDVDFRKGGGIEESRRKRQCSADESFRASRKIDHREYEPRGVANGVALSWYAYCL